MSSQIKQTLVMTRANFLSLPRRVAISLSMAFSIAFVVAVLAGFLAMANGFEKALSGAGSPHVAVVLGGGTNQETGSEIPADAIRSIQSMSGDIGVARNAKGELLGSRELMVPVEFTGTQEEQATTLALRGMDEAGPTLRDGITISEAGCLYLAHARL